MFSFFSRSSAKPGSGAAGAAAAGSGGKPKLGAGSRSTRRGGRRLKDADDEPDAKYQYRKPDDAAKFYTAMLNAALFTDIEIVLKDDARIQAHSFVLAAQSTFFATELRKIKPGTDGKRVIELPEEEEGDWKVLLQFAYSQTWEKTTDGVVGLRAKAEKFGFAIFETKLAAAVAEMFQGDIHDGLKIAAESWKAGDAGLAKTAFLAAFKQPSVALASPSLLKMPRDCLAEYLSDDRVTGNEVQVLGAALKWVKNHLEAREEAGETVEYAPWYVEHRSRAAEMEATMAAAKAARDAETETEETAAAAAAASGAASGAGGGEAEESKESEEDVEEEVEEEDTSLAAPGEVREGSSAESSASMGIGSLFGIRADSADSSDDGGALTSLFRLSSTGSVPEAKGSSNPTVAASSVTVTSGRSRVERSASDRRVWDEWTASYSDMEMDLDTTRSRFSGATLRDAMGPLMQAVRWGRVPAWCIANHVAQIGLLSPEEQVGIYRYRFLPPGFRGKHLLSAHGFITDERKPAQKQVKIIMWGGGGASGKYAEGGSGGAGGYICVQRELKPGEKLTFYVGEGGYADKGSSSATTQAWPNSGLGGYNWKTGSGGGATYFTSSLTGSEVVAGAGGGGGGSAARSFSSGGGGGGGTKDGKVGSGGDGQTPSSSGALTGKDGNGDGGKSDSGGTKKDGEHANGAGGKSGSGGTKSGGGGGGAASYKHATLVKIINATSCEAVECPITKRSAGKGGGSLAKGGDLKRGSHGMVIVKEMDTGKMHTIYFDKVGERASTKKRSPRTPYELEISV